MANSKFNHIITITTDTTDNTIKCTEEMYTALMTMLNAGFRGKQCEVIDHSDLTKKSTKTTTTKTKPVAKADNTKTTTKTTSKTSKPKAQAKSDDFDYDTYVAIAKEIGCYGNKGVWKCGRSTVYAVMNGEMTKAQAKKAIKAVVAKNGWDK